MAEMTPGEELAAEMMRKDLDWAKEAHKPRPTVRGFASELKVRIERAAVAFDQPRQTEMVAGLRYAIGIVDATLSDYDVSEPACGSPTKAE